MLISDYLIDTLVINSTLDSMIENLDFETIRELLQPPKEKYSESWFKDRAHSSIKPIAPGVWDFSDSLLLYVNSGDEGYESMQETDTPYNKIITKPEREYLSAIAAAVARELPDNFDYIDLGPGTEHKEQFLFDELKRLGKKFTYIPVDISEHYLKLSREHAVNQNIPVISQRSSFEELPQELKNRTAPRFVSIGMTFPNYDHRILIKLLGDIAGKNGYAFINAHMRDRVDMDAVKNMYGDDGVLQVALKKVALLGLDPQNDTTDNHADDGVRIWSTIKKTTPKLEQLGVHPGDKLLIFQSLRYTKDSLKKSLNETDVSYQLFDTGASFVAMLLKY